MAVRQVESQGCIEEVVGRGTVGVWIVVGDRLLLAFQNAVRSAVVIPSADVKLMTEGIDRGRLPDRAAAVGARLAAVIRQGVCLPKELAAVGIAPIEGSIVIGLVQSACARGRADIWDPHSRGV